MGPGSRCNGEPEYKVYVTHVYNRIKEFNLELRVTLLANNLPARRKEPSSRSLAGAATAVKPDWSGHVVIDFNVLVDVVERVL